MSGNRTSVTIDRYPARAVLLSCGCTPTFKASPPEEGEIITCLSHGTVRVIRRKKQRNGSSPERSGKDATT